jgi:hypothetical protein
MTNSMAAATSNPPAIVLFLFNTRLLFSTIDSLFIFSSGWKRDKKDRQSAAAEMAVCGCFPILQVRTETEHSYRICHRMTSFTPANVRLSTSGKNTSGKKVSASPVFHSW